MFAEIIIPLAVPKNYTWEIPENLHDKVRVGIRVEVSLRNRKYTGIIRNLHFNKPEGFEPKPILSVLEEEPLLYLPQLELWQWIAGYYMCTEGEVMNAAVPSYFKLNSESILVFNEEYGDNFSLLNNEEFLVAEALFIKKELKLSEVQQILDSGKVYPVIRQLALKKVCTIWESLKDRFVTKKESYIILNPVYNHDAALGELLNNWTKAPKQMELLLSYIHLFKTEGEVIKKELLKKSGASDAQLKGLIDKAILIVEKREINRLPQLPLSVTIDFTLSEAQQQAFVEIETAFKKNTNCLLHGVTGSGKTLIYIKLLEKIISEGNQALYLLPEIALTAQLIRRLQKYFGGYIAVYHSRFSDNERVELWNKVKSGTIKIIMGARSSLLLPFVKLDLIIVDEEHEPSYKQYEPAPRYHARDTAIYYAAQCKAKLLLGSATPSVETFFNVSLQKLTLVSLPERFAGLALPEIEIIDTKLQNKNQKEKLIISKELEKEINNCLAEKKQVILFKNRRGYSPYKICSLCGWMPECKHCNVALTFHKNKNHLVCHYCNTVYTSMHTCPVCAGQKFEQKNFGTEKVEEAVSELFPQAKTARMDLDSVKGKNAHSNLIKQFELGNIDILIGTQMLVKGLDFEDVHLVGIVDADSLLHFADFRVHERAFQLMEQVSGRAGRKNKQGKVLIQAMQNEHPLLQFIKNHDYMGFYNQEIMERKEFFYPPFSRLIQVQFKNKDTGKLFKAADYFAKNIPAVFQKYMIGPAEPFVNKIRNQFIMELLFKLPKDTATIQACKAAIQKQYAILQNTREFSNVVVIPNVDPV